MKIDFEGLFWIAYNHHCEISEYQRVYLKCWEKRYGYERKHDLSPKYASLNADLLENFDTHKLSVSYERVRCGGFMLWDFCDVLGIDPRKLYGLVKSIRKWYEKRKWNGSFPFDKNNDRIFNYLRKG